MGIHLIPPLYEVIIVPELPSYGPAETHYYYPDAHPESTSVDGHAYRVAAEAWSMLRAGVGTGHTDNYTYLQIYIDCAASANEWAQLRRIIALFDTSSIPLKSRINEAKLRVRVYSASNSISGATPALAVVTSNPASNTALENADYQALDSTPLTDILSWTSGFKTFTFAPSSLSAIIPGGITKLGIREATYDLGGSNPPWQFGGTMHLDVYSSERAASPSADIPRLEVTYEPPA